MAGRIFPLRIGLLTITAAGAYGLSTYVSYHVYRIYTAPEPPPDAHVPRQQKRFTGVYDALAPEYDAKIGWDEYWLGIGRLRRRLLAQAKVGSFSQLIHGNVLEVSAGTGRNFASYEPGQLTSLTLTDASPEMLRQALSKWRADHRQEYQRVRPPNSQQGSQQGSQQQQQHQEQSGNTTKGMEPSFVVMHSEKLQYEDGAFDTVVDTFGLCSHGDPVSALREMGRVCQSGTGRVLLLEHGRVGMKGASAAAMGVFGRWMNTALDKCATGHAASWGCWWNRDIMELVREAGLSIYDIETHHFGTTYVIVAGPKRPI